ncbi:MAG: hypothetical protein DRH32_07810, partial [Deltaproteobacteria bacterium]
DVRDEIIIMYGAGWSVPPHKFHKASNLNFASYKPAIDRPWPVYCYIFHGGSGAKSKAFCNFRHRINCFYINSVIILTVLTFFLPISNI